MNDRHLRSILINLQYRLSNNDRERLHFYLKNDVPRSVGDDSTLNGTLRLMQSLFDQDKISDRDLTLLIDAFQQIRCFDAVKLLKEHQRRMLLSGLNQSTQSLASIMPSLIEELLEERENDQDSADIFIPNQTTNSNNNNNIIKSHNINISGSAQKLSSQGKQCISIPSSTKKGVFLSLMLLLLTLAILIVVFIGGFERINNLKNSLQIKQDSFAEIEDQNNRTVKESNNLVLEQQKTIEQLNKILIESSTQSNQTIGKPNNLILEKNGETEDRNNRRVKQSNNLVLEQQKTIEQLNKILIESNTQSNQTIRQLNNLILEKNAEIEQLSKMVVESQSGRRTLVIKAGRIFGGDGGGDFDDSILPMFTSFHYLSAFVFSDVDRFWACQFIYTSSERNQSRIESSVHGSNELAIHSTYRYNLTDDERIAQVQVKSSYTKPHLGISTNPLWFQKKSITGSQVITGLKFITTKGRSIPPGINITGNDVESEKFIGYTLGYVTGKSGASIDQLQFFWYQTKPQ